MSVAKRKTKSGYTKEYHYAFAQDTGWQTVSVSPFYKEI